MSTVVAKPEQAYWMGSRPAVADGMSTGLLDQPRRIASPLCPTEQSAFKTGFTA